MDKITTIENITIYKLLALFFIIIGVYFRVDPLTLLTAIQGAIIMFILLNKKRGRTYD